MAAGDKIILGGIVDTEGNSFKAVVDSGLITIEEIGGLTSLFEIVEDDTHLYVLPGNAYGNDINVLYKIDKETFTVVGSYVSPSSKISGYSNIASDFDSIFVTNVLNQVEKVNKSTMSIMATSQIFGNVIWRIACDGDSLYVGGYSNILSQLSATDLTLIRNGTAYGGSVRAITFDNDFVYVLGETKRKIAKYNKSTFSRIAEGPDVGDDCAINLPIATDGERIFIGHRLGNGMSVFRTSDLVKVGTCHYPEPVTGIQIFGDDVYYCGGKSGTTMLSRILIADRKTLFAKNASLELAKAIVTLSVSNNGVYCVTEQPTGILKLKDEYQFRGFERVVV